MSLQRRSGGVGWLAVVLLVLVLFLVLIHVATFTPELVLISFGLVAVAILADRFGPVI